MIVVGFYHIAAQIRHDHEASRSADWSVTAQLTQRC
jgi:hypothetical protein